MQMIVEVLGYPTEEELELYSEVKERETLKSLPRKPGRSFE